MILTAIFGIAWMGVGIYAAKFRKCEKDTPKGSDKPQNGDVTGDAQGGNAA